MAMLENFALIKIKIPASILYILYHYKPKAKSSEFYCLLIIKIMLNMWITEAGHLFNSYLTDMPILLYRNHYLFNLNFFYYENFKFNRFWVVAYFK